MHSSPLITSGFLLKYHFTSSCVIPIKIFSSCKKISEQIFHYFFVFFFKLELPDFISRILPFVVDYVFIFFQKKILYYHNVCYSIFLENKCDLVFKNSSTVLIIKPHFVFRVFKRFSHSFIISSLDL